MLVELLAPCNADDFPVPATAPMAFAEATPENCAALLRVPALDGAFSAPLVWPFFSFAEDF